MIILTMLIIVIMLLMWLGLASLGVQFSDTIGWLLFLAAIAVVFALYALTPDGSNALNPKKLLCARPPSIHLRAYRKNSFELPSLPFPDTH